MAVYFQLYRQGQAEPSTFQAIDNHICAYFGVEPHPVHFFHRWYDIIGFSLACGKSFEWIKERLGPEDQAWSLYGIACFLEEHYQCKAWWGR